MTSGRVLTPGRTWPYGVTSRPGRTGSAADVERIHPEPGGDLLDDAFGRGDPLRAAEAPERGVRRQVRPADRPLDGDIGEEVGVVGVEHRPLHHRQAEVERAAAVGEQLQLQRGDRPVVVEPDPVAGQVRVPLAGDAACPGRGRRRSAPGGRSGRRRARPAAPGARPATPCRRSRPPSGGTRRRPGSGAGPGPSATTLWTSLGFCVDDWTRICPPSPGTARAACGSR